MSSDTSMKDECIEEELDVDSDAITPLPERGKQYIVKSNSSLKKLMEIVDGHINGGWYLHGGFTAAVRTSYKGSDGITHYQRYFYQAMKSFKD